MSKHLSIIITHFKTPELLFLCIDSIKKNIGGIVYEIIVLDIEFEEKTERLIKEKFKNIKFIKFKKNVGYSKAVNQGLKKAKNNYVLILNADIIVLEGSIQKLLDFISNNSNVGIVGPQLLDFTNNVQISCFKNPTLKSILARRTMLGKLKWGKKVIKEFEINLKNIKKSIEIDWMQGSAMMLRKNDIDKVGPLDEKFFMYFEDADWCRRFKNKGYKIIYLPQSKMVHYYHRASKKWGAILDFLFNKYARTHIISALKYFWKYKNKNDKI